ncbi:MAG: hypothetical protein ACRD12_00885 [Acidimicrobiales bacterium]
MTEGGHAYHVHSDCPALQEGRTHPLHRTTLAAVMGEWDGCYVCVYGMCMACAVGRHDRCTPTRSTTGACSCADRRHR